MPDLLRKAGPLQYWTESGTFFNDMSIILVNIIWTTSLFLPVSAESGLSTQTSISTPLPATTPAVGPIMLFVDRFGTIYLSHSPIKIDALVPALKNKNTSLKQIVLIYDPISLEVDRQRLFQRLRDALPASQIVFQTAEGDEYAKWLFPAHEPEVLEQVLSRQILSDPKMGIKPEALIAQIESYLTNLTMQSNQFHAELASFEQGYQKATTRPVKKCCEKKLKDMPSELGD
jgi:biopolymer transport protein ExbD